MRVLFLMLSNLFFWLGVSKFREKKIAIGCAWSLFSLMFAIAALY